MEIELKEHSCIGCGVVFWITKKHDEELLKTKRNFYCPNGHAQSYTGKSDKDKFREEREKNKELQNQIYDLEQKLIKEKEVKTPVKKKLKKKKHGKK